jgi:hypothetical protein
MFLLMFGYRYLMKRGANYHAQVVDIKQIGISLRPRVTVRFICSFTDASGGKHLVKSRLFIVNSLGGVENYIARVYVDRDKPKRFEIMIFAKSGNAMNF